MDRSEPAAFGSGMTPHFRLSEPPPTLVREVKKNPFAVTRMTYPRPHLGMTTPIPLQNALLIGLQLHDCPNSELWVDGKHLGKKPLMKDQFSLYDLRLDTAACLHDPFDHLQFYLPLASLNEVALESNLSCIDTIKVSLGVGQDDPIVTHIGACLLSALQQNYAIEPLFIDSIAVALYVHLLSKYNGARFNRSEAPGKLPTWRLRRAIELLDANLDGGISVSELAQQCELSVSHFTRAFRATAGMAPHTWLQRRRIEKAKMLLSTAALPLADIALLSGFSDQSHMTKVFGKHVGATPGRWRTLHRQ